MPASPGYERRKRLAFGKAAAKTLDLLERAMSQRGDDGDRLRALFEFIEGSTTPPPSFIDRVSLPDRLRASSCGRSRRTHEPAAVLAGVKEKPSGRPPSGSSLMRATAAPLCGPGGKNGSARGPNKRMAPNRSAKCHQTRYLDSPRNRGRSTGKGDGGTRLAPLSAKPSESPGP